MLDSHFSMSSLAACSLRLDFITPLPDIDQRLQSWEESTVAKSVKSAESAFLKALKKKNANLNTPEALAQLESITTEAREKAKTYFQSLPIPLGRLGSTSEANTVRARLMADAVQRAQGMVKEREICKIGYAAALTVKERDGSLQIKSKKKNNKKDKGSSTQCLVTLGKHMLK